MNATHKDVIDYINYMKPYYNSDDYLDVLDDKLIVYKWFEFKDFQFSALPNNMVFNTACDLEGSKITSVPEDIVLNGSLYIGRSKIRTLPVLNIRLNLKLSHSKFTLADCTYIGATLISTNSKYETLHGVYINGYMFSTGILS